MRINWSRQCVAVVPCFNEAVHIAAVVVGIQRHLPNVIVVDDGSTDATAERAEAAGAIVIRQPRNSGKGSALRRGWERARELGFAWVLMLDGDAQHAPDDIPGFFAAAESSAAVLVVGKANRVEGEALSGGEGLPRAAGVSAAIDASAW